jgi:hypothetical protein
MADLKPGEVPILGEQGAAMLEQRGHELGIFCHSCGLEMSGAGFEFISLRAVTRETRPTVVETRAFICGRDECAEAREAARQRATAVKPAGGWQVLTGPAEEPEDEAPAEEQPSG